MSPPSRPQPLKDLFPELSGDELEEAKENFDRYLLTVYRMSERIRLEQEEGKIDPGDKS